MLKSELRGDAELRARFIREAGTMRRAHSPRVMPSVELGELEDGALFLRMPLYEGTVRDRLAQGPIAEATCRQWAEDLLEGLAHLASLGIVHRDVKPSNLLLDADDRLVLGDFGVALVEDEARLTRTLQHLGSLAYMAPEHRGDRRVTPAADVYSASLVLHEVVTGEPPGARPGHGIVGPLGEVIRSMATLDVEERATAEAALAHLRDPLGGALNLPLPSDDGRIALTALLVSLLGFELCWVASAWLHPAALHGEPAPIVPVLVTSLILPGVLAGFAMHRWSLGSPTRTGAFAGAWATLGAWILGAGTFAQIASCRRWIGLALEGGHGISQLDLARRVAEPVLLANLIEFAAIPVVLLVGALVGGTTGAGAQRVAPRPIRATQPHWVMLEAAASVPALLGVPVIVATAAAGSILAQPVVTTDPDNALVAVLAFALHSLGWITAAIVIAAQAVLWQAAAMRWRRQIAEDERRWVRTVNAGFSALLLFAPDLWAAGLLWFIEFPGNRLLVLILLLTPVLGAVRAMWVIRRLPTPPELQGSVVQHTIGTLAISILASLLLFGPYVSTTLTVGVVVGWGISDVQSGLITDPAEPARWIRTTWFGLGAFVGFVVCAGLTQGAITVLAAGFASSMRQRAALIALPVVSVLGCGSVAGFVADATDRLVEPAPEAWPHSARPDPSEPERPGKGRSGYLGGAKAVLTASPTGTARETLEEEADWLEAAVFLALLRELDGVHESVAWTDAKTLAEVSETDLARVVRAWPDAESALLEAEALQDDPILQILHATLVAKHQVDPEHPLHSGAIDAVFALGRRLELPYLLAMSAAVGPGRPDADGLETSDLVVQDAVSWMGEQRHTIRSLRVLHTLRAGDLRMARELVTGVERPDLDIASRMVEVGQQTDDAVLTALGMEVFAAILDPEDASEEPPTIHARAVADAAIGLALREPGEADALFRAAHAKARTPWQAEVIAHGHQAVRRIDGATSDLWPQGLQPWPLDACETAGVAALAGEGPWETVLAARGPCHHAGIHQLWRDRASVAVEDRPPLQDQPDEHPQE